MSRQFDFREKSSRLRSIQRPCDDGQIAVSINDHRQSSSSSSSSSSSKYSYFQRKSVASYHFLRCRVVSILVAERLASGTDKTLDNLLKHRGRGVKFEDQQSSQSKFKLSSPLDANRTMTRTSHSTAGLAYLSLILTATSTRRFSQRSGL